MLAILVHLPRPPPSDTSFWVVLLGRKSFPQYWFRIWSNGLFATSCGVLALLLITAELEPVSTAPCTKSFSPFREHKKTESWMQVARRADASEEKCLALECCGLAHDLRLSLIFGIFPCVDISVYSQEQRVCRCMGKLLCSSCALNVRLCPPISHLAYLVITVSRSTVLYCPCPHADRAIQKRYTLLHSWMKVSTMILNAMHGSFMPLTDLS